MKIGVMFGNPEVTPGGRALKFYSSIRLDVRKVEFINEGTDNIVGLSTRIKAVKNKTAPPMRKAEVEIIFGKGLQSEKEYIDFAVDLDIIDKAGSWYSYKEERIGQGKDNAVSFMKNNSDIFEDIKKRVDNFLSGKGEETVDEEVSKSSESSKPAESKEPTSEVLERPKRGRPKKTE